MDRQLIHWAAFGIVAGGAILLLQDHLGHLRQFFPFLLVLACPLMHIFMHRGHGAHGERETPAQAHHHELGPRA